MSQNKSDTFEERWNKLYRDFMERYPSRVDSKNTFRKKAFIKEQDFLLRLSRAMSWFNRAKQLRQLRKESIEERKKDLDAQFIFFWISFNALYARDPVGYFGRDGVTEKILREKYFCNLWKFDKKSNRIYEVIENTKEVLDLLKNEFVAHYFWNHYHENPFKRDEEHPSWNKMKNTKKFKSAEEKRDISKMLTIIFGYLYTLRNQVMHGGSAWKVDHLNRGQLDDAAGIMHKLLPVFIDIMLENPDADWGDSFYPRILGKPIIDKDYLKFN